MVKDENLYIALCGLSVGQEKPATYPNEIMAAMEEIEHGNYRAKLINQLYKDFLKRAPQKIDYITETKGDITKCKLYDGFVESMNSIEKMLPNKKPKVYSTLEDMHQMMIDLRGDYEFGFRMSIDMLIVMYNISAQTMFALLDAFITSYANHVKTGKSLEDCLTETSNANALLFKNAAKICNTYKKGEWGKMVAVFKKNQRNLVGGGILSTIVVAGASAVGLYIVIMGIISCFRELSYLYYNSRVKVSDWAKNQASFIETVNEDLEVSDKKKKKNSALAQKLYYLSDKTSIQMKKAENEAQKDIAQSNRSELSPGAISASEDPSMVDAPPSDMYGENDLVVF